MKLKYSMVGVALALMVTACSSSSSDSTTTEVAASKNVIFFLGDGYGIVPMTAARIYAEGEDGTLAIDTLPETAFIKTFSLDAQVTDSAPSMAAYMTGVKTRNEVLAMDADTLAIAPSKDAVTGVSNSVNNCPIAGNGKASATLLELAIAKGMGTGVVSTARLTHATPAATYAHVCHRNAEYEIARQTVPGGSGFNSALGAGVDVLMGGLSQYWTPYSATTNKLGRPDGRDLIAEMKAKGYSFASDLASTRAAPTSIGGKLLALYDFAAGEGHMSYELDRDPAKEPSLSEMTTKAMDVLANNKKATF
jgi:alkaline phosphatase